MIQVLKKFFAFCTPEDRAKFRTSVILSLFQAIFEAMKIPAIAVMVKALLEQNVTGKTCLCCLGIMLVSIIGSGIVKSKASMLQTEGGYGTCASKRMEIAKHLRYLPMGYYNANSLGQITSVTTNTMQNLENVATRVVMMVTSGLLNTAVITLMLIFFDWRIGLLLIAGLAVFFAINNGMMKRSEIMSHKKVKSDADMVEKVLEYVQGISEVKAYKLTGKKAAELNKVIDINENANRSMELTLIPFMTAQTFTLKVIGTAMTVASILLHLNGSMPLLTCILMIISSYIVYANLQTAGSYSAQAGLAAADPLFPCGGRGTRGQRPLSRKERQPLAGGNLGGNAELFVP